MDLLEGSWLVIVNVSLRSDLYRYQEHVSKCLGLVGSFDESLALTIVG